jgi:phosphoenolpyruvate carboxykinase (ATP)
VPTEVLDPRASWADKGAYDEAARNLAARFQKNFIRFKGVPEEVRQAGPAT